MPTSMKSLINKYTHRLAQRPGSYVILKYQRDVVRHKVDQTLSTAAAPSGLERGLRCIPMGGKNWMFFWTEEGADNVAEFKTLITSCLLAGIDPYKYLVDVLQRISLHPARDIRELIRRLWKEKFAANPLKADLDK